MRINTGRSTSYSTNHMGLRSKASTPEQMLTRLTLANMLWEDQFYMDGKATAGLVAQTVKQANPEFVADLAVRARSEFKLRHVPLLLTRELARNGKLKAETLASVIQRPDEMGEFLSIYWKDGKKPLANQVKKGLAQAFGKFNEYSLAKWDKNSAAISLRDVMFLTHPKPVDEAQTVLFKKIADKALATPDTWETELSAGADKRATFERLMAERKLGALAFVRNLRNMVQAGVSIRAIESYAATVNVERVLPFRFIAAVKHVPSLKGMLESMMFRCLEGQAKLPGKTRLLVDVSGSMYGPKVSGKSDLERFEAAAALAVLCRELCETVEVYSFTTRLVKIDASKRGFALVQALRESQSGGTALGASYAQLRGQASDRDIVFTDGESTDRPGTPAGRFGGYLINVAAYQNGIGQSDWMEINGFSEAVFDYILAVENLG